MCPLLSVAAAAEPQIVQCVVVEKAQIARPRLANEGKYGWANIGHQIVKGNRSVLALRDYRNHDGPPDSQTFKKATLEIALPSEIAMGEQVAVDVLRSYYVQGGSAWVEKGGYAWAANPFEKILIGRNKGGLHVKLLASIDATSKPSFARNRPEDRMQADFECPLQRQIVSELTPWVGRPGTNQTSFQSMEWVSEIGISR